MTARAPSLSDALLPIGVLVVLLSLSVYLFGDASSSGPNQIALMSAAFVAGLVGLKNGLRWAEIEAIFLAHDKDERVLLLINLLQRENTLSFHLKDISKV